MKTVVDKKLIKEERVFDGHFAKVHLIAIAFPDGEGHKRLEKALHIEKPDVITIEDSEKRQRFLEDAIRLHFDYLIDVLKQKRLPQEDYSVFKDFLNEYFTNVINFSYNVSRNYSHPNEVPLILIDDPSQNNDSEEIIRENLCDILDLIESIPESQNSLEEEAIEFYINDQEDLYRKLEEYYQSCDDGNGLVAINSLKIDPNMPLILGPRDLYMADRLSELSKRYGHKKIVHIGHWLHTLDDLNKETLYSKIKHLNPTRTTLKYYD